MQVCALNQATDNLLFFSNWSANSRTHVGCGVGIVGIVLNSLACPKVVQCFGHRCEVKLISRHISHFLSGKIFTQQENDTDIGNRATEMCPNKKAIGIWLSALGNL